MKKILIVLLTTCALIAEFKSIDVKLQKQGVPIIDFLHNSSTMPNPLVAYESLR